MSLLAGDMRLDLTKDPIGVGRDGKPVMLDDIWPSTEEVRQALEKALTPAMFRKRYSDVFKGTEQWQRVKAPQGFTFTWAEPYVPQPVEYAVTLGAVALVASGILLFAKLLPIVPLWDVKEGQVVTTELRVGRARVPATLHE